MALDQTTSAPVPQAPARCTLCGDQLSDRMQVVASVFAKCEESRELPDGYEFRFPGNPESVMQLAEFISDERSCCAFLTLELIFEPNQGPAWLRLRGGELVKELFGPGGTPVVNWRHPQ